MSDCYVHFVHTSDDESALEQTASAIRSFVDAHPQFVVDEGQLWYEPQRLLEFERPRKRVELSLCRWGAFDCFGNFEGARCRRCGAVWGDDDPVAYVDTWWESKQTPTLACAECGWDALASEWDLKFAVACGWHEICIDSFDPDEACDLLPQLQLAVPGGWSLVFRRI